MASRETSNGSLKLSSDHYMSVICSQRLVACLGVLNATPTNYLGCVGAVEGSAKLRLIFSALATKMFKEILGD